MKLKHKIGIGSAIFIVAFVLLGLKFFSLIHEDEWATYRDAVNTAYEKTVLVKPVKVDRFISNKQYTVIQGEDKIGHPVIVWVSEDEVITEMASDGVTQEQVEQSLTAADPEASLLRVTPGKLDDQLVWEAFYKKPADGGEHFFYNYYAFTDGSLIDTYRLSLQ
ncbi:DUF5590 domain-containing protein [Paenibacillus thalictri]|uniref:Cell wall elongation regulator TseB-like domain-containing protein n=1 Tax=Paenibacillus thalictri TaxID=2527873 RepID=A0A4Q9DUS5_9BACL|nr:DUF5590 domain-containing protein [Paenibacillus thalictri]TBL79700.1 hypothetical protein EYB31_08800 [Paenibacillus thalictri]